MEGGRQGGREKERRWLRLVSSCFECYWPAQRYRISPTSVSLNQYSLVLKMKKKIKIVFPFFWHKKYLLIDFEDWINMVNLRTMPLRPILTLLFECKTSLLNYVLCNFWIIYRHLLNNNDNNVDINIALLLKFV